MLAVTALIALAVIYKIKKRGGIKRNITFYSLAAAVLIYTVIIWQYKLAEEKIHFFEYGVLGFLIYRALIVDVRGFRVYIFTLILGFMLGWIDEIIQRMLPNRYYEFRDVMMNGVGVLMAIAIILIVNMDKHLFNKRHIN